MKMSILNSIGQKFAGSTTCSFDWSIEIAKISTRKLECTRCLPYLSESDSHFIFLWKTFYRNLKYPYSITRYEIVVSVPPPAFDLTLVTVQIGHDYDERHFNAIFQNCCFTF